MDLKSFLFSVYTYFRDKLIQMEYFQQVFIIIYVHKSTNLNKQNKHTTKSRSTGK